MLEDNDRREAAGACSSTPWNAVEEGDHCSVGRGAFYAFARYLSQLSARLRKMRAKQTIARLLRQKAAEVAMPGTFTNPDAGVWGDTQYSKAVNAGNRGCNSMSTRTCSPCCLLAKTARACTK